MGRGHPECPERLDAIEDRLLISGVGDALDRREAPLAPLADLELTRAFLSFRAQLLAYLAVSGCCFCLLVSDRF